jgi:hypothetical protein
VRRFRLQNLYVGGDFTGIHGRAQQRFAILPNR